MDSLSLFLDDKFKIGGLILVQIDLLSKGTALDFEVIDLLLHEVFVLL